MNSHEIAWCLAEARAALDNGHADLAHRYIEKAQEQVWCMTCHGVLDDARPYRPHFKGFVHVHCAAWYHGRLDYLAQHPREDDFPGAT